jgi:glucuronoarabinoxylan endo-1,4-beta-xylanase
MKTRLCNYVISGILLVHALLFAACPAPEPDGEKTPPNGNAGQSSLAPLITAQPAGGDYWQGETIAPLKVTANGSGSLTYQWYKALSPAEAEAANGSPIAGASSPAYTPSETAPGDYYYYAKVTNTEGQKPAAAKQSKTAHVKITTPQGGPINTGGKTLAFNAAVEYQYVHGFGGMSHAFGSPAMTAAEIDTLFSPAGLGLNIFRIFLPDNLNNNLLTAYYPLVKKVNGYGGYVLATPWSPPANLKDPATVNSSETTKSKLKPENYAAYATHLRNFLQKMNDNGAPVYVLSIQNEPNYHGGYDGCDWTGEEMRDFFKQVGHFTTTPTAIKGWGGGKEQPHVLTMNGESFGTPAINDPAMDDPASRAVIDLLGRHIYDQRTVKYTKGLDYGKQVWMTEINTNTANKEGYAENYDSTWPAVWTFVNDIHNCMHNNNESAFIHWYSKRFYGLIGDGQKGTTMGQPLYRGYALSQYAKFASGATRIALTASGGLAINADLAAESGLKATAYKGPNGSFYSMVIVNPTSTNFGDVEIKFPAGFTAASATAMKTSEAGKGTTETVLIGGAKTSGYIKIPASSIVSVKLSK